MQRILAQVLQAFNCISTCISTKQFSHSLFQINLFQKVQVKKRGENQN